MDFIALLHVETVQDGIRTIQLRGPLNFFAIYCKTDCDDMFKSEVDTNEWSIKITTWIIEHVSAENHLLVMYKATKS